MKLAFLAGAATVTGSRIPVSHEGKQVLVDCGLFQGYKNLRLMERSTASNSTRCCVGSTCSTTSRFP